MHRSGIILIGLIAASLLPAPASAEIPIPANVPVSGPLVGLQNEEQVWICPADTNVVVANHRDFRLGYRQIGLGRSVDGGATWVDTLIHPDYHVFTHQSDPVMTVNSSGHIFLNHLDYRRGVSPYDSSYLAFLVSEDCGETWNGPYTVEDTVGPYFEDKQFITCDRSGGPHDGNVYISWTRFATPTRIMFARSTTGAVSFDDTLIVGPTFFPSCYGFTWSAGQFSQPLVGKDGAVYVFWQGVHIDSIADCTASNAIRVNKSTDGGVSWQGDRLVRAVDGWSSVDGGVDVYSQPTTDADLSGGPHSGNLYLQYRDINPAAPFDSDIMFQRSLDTGGTWSTPIRVNDDPVGPEVDQFHNWLVCNEEGVLASIWYDQRTDPAHFKFDVFAGYSYDGGATWTSNHRISDVSIDPNILAAAKAAAREREGLPKSAGTLSPDAPLAGLIAEYIGLSCVGDKLVAVWTDTRVFDQDVYSAGWYLPLTDPRLIYPLDGEAMAPETPELQWATAWKETEDLYRVQIDDDPAFGSPERDIWWTNNSFTDPLTDLASGLYHWRIKAYRAPGWPGSDPTDSTDFSASGSFDLGAVSCACDCHADPECDGQTNVFDVVHAVAVGLRNEPDVPDPNPACPRNTTDVDCDNDTDIFDVVKLVNVGFRNELPQDNFCDPCAP